MFVIRRNWTLSVVAALSTIRISSSSRVPLLVSKQTDTIPRKPLKVDLQEN